jgi:hypothetical protein
VLVSKYYFYRSVFIISWPCVLKLDGDDELIYLGCEKELKIECGELIFSDDDYVIDSAGFSYFLSKTLNLMKTDKVFSVNELIDLVRANEFKKAELCITKIHFVTVSDAISSLAY